MRTFSALFKRELMSLFFSPIAYVVMMFFLLITGFGFFWLINDSLDLSHSTQGLMIIIWASMLVVIPTLTMRTFCEERKNGTFEALLTTPTHESTVVLAKFFGVFVFFLLMCAPTIAYMLIIRRLAPDEASLFDPGAIIMGYLTIALMASSFISLGLVASALTSSQIISATATFSVMSILFLGGLFEPHLSSNPLVRNIGSYISSIMHVKEAARGVFDSRVIVLYLSMTLFFLFTATRIIEAKR